MGLYLSMGFKTSAWAMNKFYSLPLAWWPFSFTSASSIGFHMSTPHIFYPPWEPHTSSLSSSIGNNTLLLGLFHDRLRGLYRLAWCNKSSLFQLRKGLTLLHLRKASSTHTSFPLPTAKGTLITLPPLSHITMSSDTTCWKDKQLGKLP